MASASVSVGESFWTTAWNNGEHHRTGAGYGLKISEADRDRFLSRSWRTIFLAIPGFSQSTEVNISKGSMWDGPCRELIHSDIGQWLIREGRAPWPARQPPKVEIAVIGPRQFAARIE